MAPKLDAYRAKRRFSDTPEPQGGEPTSEELIFVVQKHGARRLHYDLRLQVGDVLKSWAVPEGPCLDPKVRRFAKEVEDHPLDYAGFEGDIPAGAYGAGHMIVWDRGVWVTLADPLQALAKGELKFRLAGEKLAGGWMLKRLPEDATHWLLIKERDGAARTLEDYDVLKQEPQSVVTGHAIIEEVAPPPPPRPPPRPRASRLRGALAKPMPSRWKPQLVTPAPSPPVGDDWIHEIKYDGYRTLAFVDGGRTRFVTRNGFDWTERYGALARPFEALRCKSAILDGEIVVQDTRGATSLSLLEDALSAGETGRLVYYAFDLVYLDGYDLSALSLSARKTALMGLIGGTDAKSALQYSDHVEGDGAALFAQASRMGLEGIVSKRRDARYVQARSALWLKIKRADLGTFIVVGFVCNMPDCVSSLLIAEERAAGLVYAGRVGSGLTDAAGRGLYRDLAAFERPTASVLIPKINGARWVEPEWTVDISYRDRSANDAPRAPVFLSYSRRSTSKPKHSLKPKLVRDRDLAAIELTNPHREIFKGSGVTKLDVALYYARVGDWMLPELLGRPLTVFRCPSGDAKDCFYQRHAFAGLPPGLEVAQLADEKERADFLVIAEARGYLALPQFGAIELHPWGCRVDNPDHPDRMIFDLDPDIGLPWPRVCEGAEKLRERLQSMGISPFLRTTGGKGLHLVVALQEGVHGWRELKQFTGAVAAAMAAEFPALFTATSAKARRQGRIYIDYLRNGRGATAVASYSLRARKGFPAAAPIEWEEMRQLPGGDAFNLSTLPKRLESLARDPWNALLSSPVTITAQMKRDVGLKT